MLNFKNRIILLLVLLTNLSACSMNNFSEDVNSENGLLNTLSTMNEYVAIEVFDSVYIDRNKVEKFGYDVLSNEQFKFKTYEPVGIEGALISLSKKTNQYINIVDSPSYNESLEKEDVFKLEFEGSVSEYIKYIESIYNVDIKSKQSSLEVRYFVSKMYSLSSLSEQYSSVSEFKFDSRESSTINAKGTVEIEGNFWSNFEPFIVGIVKNGEYSLLKDLSSVLVKERPSQHKELSKVFGEIEKSTSQTIEVNYAIYEFDLNEVTELAAQLGISSNNVTSSFLSFNTLQSTVTGTFASNPDVNFGLQALLTLDSSNLVSEGHLKTLSNRPVPLNLTKTTSYAAKVERDSGSGDSDNVFTSIEPGSVDSGLSVMFQPRVLSDGRIQLDGGFSKVSLLGIVEFSGSIQLPETSAVESFSSNIIEQNKPTIIYSYIENSLWENQDLGLLGVAGSNKKSKKLVGIVVNARVSS